jgi:hypothetical protein
VVAAAKCGDVVAFAAGSYGPRIGIGAAKACPAGQFVTLDMSGGAPLGSGANASTPWLYFSGASGFRVVGGDLGAGAVFSAVQVIGSSFLDFEGDLIHGYGARGGAGISLKDSHDITIRANAFRDAPGDGVDVVNSWNITTQFNSFGGMTYGQVVHVDGEQIWNVAGDPNALGNIDFSFNDCGGGGMQCFTAFGQDVSRPVLGVRAVWNTGVLGNAWGVAVDGVRGNVPPMPDKLVAHNHFEVTAGYPLGWIAPGAYDAKGAIPGNYSCTSSAGAWNCPPPPLPTPSP